MATAMKAGLAGVYETRGQLKSQWFDHPLRLNLEADHTLKTF